MSGAGCLANLEDLKDIADLEDLQESSWFRDDDSLPFLAYWFVVDAIIDSSSVVRFVFCFWDGFVIEEVDIFLRIWPWLVGTKFPEKKRNECCKETSKKL